MRNPFTKLNLKPLTRKYVFECALKGERIKIIDDDWLNNKLLWSTGLISKLDDEAMCYVLHDLAIMNHPNENNPAWRQHSMDAGTPLANMDRW